MGRPDTGLCVKEDAPRGEGTMQAVILCGGKGTRLRELTQTCPKPLVEIGERPILWHILNSYAHHGVTKFVLCLGYRGNLIKQYFLNYDLLNNDFTVNLGGRAKFTLHDAPLGLGLQVTLTDTGAHTMTGGRLTRARRYIEGETFMVTYGDGLSDVDIRATLAFHRSHGRLATVTAVRPESRYGILDVSSDDQAIRFAEKPRLDGWANAGFFVFQRQVLDYLGDDDCILERAPLERLAEEGELMVYRHEGFFHGMDSYRDYETLNALWDSGQAPWKVGGEGRLEFLLAG
jgi:glucose-1-phosphate cytidylyltransferase